MKNNVLKKTKFAVNLLCLVSLITIKIPLSTLCTLKNKSDNAFHTSNY